MSGKWTIIIFRFSLRNFLRIIILNQFLLIFVQIVKRFMEQVKRHLLTYLVVSRYECILHFQVSLILGIHVILNRDDVILTISYPNGSGWGTCILFCNHRQMQFCFGVEDKLHCYTLEVIDINLLQVTFFHRSVAVGDLVTRVDLNDQEVTLVNILLSFLLFSLRRRRKTASQSLVYIHRCSHQEENQQ